MPGQSVENKISSVLAQERIHWDASKLVGSLHPLQDVLIIVDLSYQGSRGIAFPKGKTIASQEWRTKARREVLFPGDEDQAVHERPSYASNPSVAALLQLSQPHP